jgi:hypothetical protein
MIRKLRIAKQSKVLKLELTPEVETALRALGRNIITSKYMDVLEAAGMLKNSRRLNDYGRAAMTLLLLEDGHLRPQEVELHL